jgi:hypothetical protein
MSNEPSVLTDPSELDVADLRVEEDSYQAKLTEGDEELTLSAYVARNSSVFPKVLDLHVQEGVRIADVTWGKGVFWKDIDLCNYELYASDLDPDRSPSGHAIDCRSLPFEDDSLDAVVLDPPYAEGYFRRNKEMMAGSGSHSSFREHYSSGEILDTNGSKYHEAVLDLYYEAGVEARRVLNDDGTLIVKVQDEVSANTQELTHIQITNFYEGELDFYTKDLFVVVRSNTPSVSGMKNQVHARKNHSFFMVYEMNTNDPVNVLRPDS